MNREGNRAFTVVFSLFLVLLLLVAFPLEYSYPLPHRYVAQIMTASDACIVGQCGSGGLQSGKTSTTTSSTTIADLVATSITVLCTPTTAVYGAPSLCTATVSTASGVLGARVVFSSSDRRGVFSQLDCWSYSNQFLRSSQTSHSLECAIDYTPRSYVRQVITAVYLGDAAHATSQATYSFSVDRAGSAFQQQLQKQQAILTSPGAPAEVASPALSSSQGSLVWFSVPLPMLAFEISIVIGAIFALAVDNYSGPRRSRKKQVRRNIRDPKARRSHSHNSA